MTTRQGCGPALRRLGVCLRTARSISYKHRGNTMNHHVADAIRSFVSRDPSPTFVDFLNQDAPQYQWTKALVEALVGRTLAWNQTQATGAIELLSDDGTPVLRIKTSQAGPPVPEGLMAEDL